MMADEFNLSKIILRLLKFWWVLAAIMIVVGGVGVFVSRIHTPIYQSKAVITSVIDYSLLGKIDDYQSDQIYVGIGELIESTAVKEAAYQELQTQGTVIGKEEFENSLTLQRQDTRWLLYVRYSNPEIAQKIDQVWAEQAMLAIDQMKSKATKQFLSDQYLNSLVTCLQNSVVVDSTSSVCNQMTYESIQKEIEKVLSENAASESADSLLILHTSSEITQSASYSASPVILGQNTSALAGMLLGLIAGLFFFTHDWQFRKRFEK
jgi:hypothetical protein